MGMSYRRAWLLVETMNACFATPLVRSSRGGAERGKAVLTDTGEEVLQRFRRIEAATMQVTRRDRAALERLTRRP
jgi:molybdate transport system regulatory protein